MDAELDLLHGKILQLAELCRQLRLDNNQLRDRLAEREVENRDLKYKVEGNPRPHRKPAGATARGDAMSQVHIEVNLLGRRFAVGCPKEEQASLVEAVALLEQRMAEVRDVGRVVEVDKIRHHRRAESGQ